MLLGVGITARPRINDNPIGAWKKHTGVRLGAYKSPTSRFNGLKLHLNAIPFPLRFLNPLQSLYKVYYVLH